MTGGLFFTSDTHFLHRMAAAKRGFTTVEEHDEALIANWNATVAPGDTVWHLGDVTLSNPARVWPLVDRLNGTTHLITGNHDQVWPGHRDAFRHQREWLGHFASVQAFARRRIAGQEVLLSHFPYRGGGDHTTESRYEQYRLADEGLWLLHGHTHSKERLSTSPDTTTLPPGGGWRRLRRQVHVGLDAWGLRPVALHEAEALITLSAPVPAEDAPH